MAKGSWDALAERTQAQGKEGESEKLKMRVRGGDVRQVLGGRHR